MFYILERQIYIGGKLKEARIIIQSEKFDEEFNKKIQKQIVEYSSYTFEDPDLSKSEILRVTNNFSKEWDRAVWVVFTFGVEQDTILLNLSESNPDVYTDLVLDVKKWRNGINRAKQVLETKDDKYIYNHETKQSSSGDYVFA